MPQHTAVYHTCCISYMLYTIHAVCHSMLYTIHATAYCCIPYMPQHTAVYHTCHSMLLGQARWMLDLVTPHAEKARHTVPCACHTASSQGLSQRPWLRVDLVLLSYPQIRPNFANLLLIVHAAPLQGWACPSGRSWCWSWSCSLSAGQPARTK